jgi:hypothetical protein
MTNQINNWKKSKKRVNESGWLSEGIDLYAENLVKILFKEYPKLKGRVGVTGEVFFI